jgi:hypothetical protein
MFRNNSLSNILNNSRIENPVEVPLFDLIYEISIVCSVLPLVVMECVGIVAVLVAMSAQLLFFEASETSLKCSPIPSYSENSLVITIILSMVGVL